MGDEVVEEVVAVVGSTPVLRSDVVLAGLVRLLEPDPDEPPDSYRSRLVRARVRLELQYRDLAESGTLYRLDLDSETTRIALVERAGGEQRLRAAMVEEGLTWADLEELGVRVAAAAAYTEQRLRPRIRVTLDELQTAYQELAARLEGTGDPVPPLTAVSDQLHQLLVERKLNAEIEQWLAAAAERHEITRFVP